MPALFFPTPDALRLALASGLAPAAPAQARARAGIDAGGVWLELDELPPRESLAALGRLGVRALAAPAVATRPVRCWAEVLPLRRAEAPPPGPALFDLPAARLARFVARLRRVPLPALGVRLLPDPHEGRAWVTAAAFPPPAALGAEPDLRAYWRQAAGVWVVRGREHPLPEHLVAPTGCVLLCDERGVACVPGEAPEPLFAELALPPAPAPPAASAAAPRVEVRFRLARADGPDAEESLWVLRGAESGAFRDFCRGADERLLRPFEVAAVGAGSEARHLVRRARANERPAQLPPVAAGYRADPRLPWLFVPAGFALRPAVRAHELARELGRGAGQLVWLEQQGEGVAVHAVAEAAFRPLAEQVEYAAPRAAALAAEPRPEEAFAFDRFALQVETTIEILAEPAPEVESPEGAPEAAGHEPGWVSKSLARMLRWVRRERGHAEAGQSEPEAAEPVPPGKPGRPREGRTGRVERKLASADALLHGQDWAARRHELEARLLADSARLGPDERARRWAELAAVYGATGQWQDAAVCWASALWDRAAPPEEWLEHWAAAECRAAKRADWGADLERWLGEPGRPGAGRVVAALAALRGSRATPQPEFVAALPRVLAVLEQQFDDIPVRAAWLARLAAARSCEGDVLGVARWRDRLVRRLRERGPGLDLDEPSFLRFRGRANAERFKVARDWLVRVKGPAREWVKRPAGIDGLQAVGLAAEMRATAEYAQMMFAWGLGVLGERATSRDWSARARKELSRATGPRADPAGHAFLGDLFLHRIKEAHEGHAPKPGLPAELQERLEKLPEFARYSADRLREHSRILQPVGPVRAFRGRDLREFWGGDRLGERLSLLASRTDPGQVGEEARALLGVAGSAPSTTTVPRIAFALVEVAPQLDATQLDALLELVPDALDWLEAWVQAGRWSDAERAGRVARLRARMIEGAFAVAPAAAAERLTRHLARAAAGSMHAPAVAAAPRVFRAARRYDLTAAAEALIQALDPARAEWAEAPPAPERVGLAAGWFLAGDEEAGNRILDAARDALYLGAGDDLPHRTALALAYAEALGFAPASISLGRLEEIFQRLDRVTVHCSSNCYFTLQPLRLIDTVVRSVVTDDFTLGPAVRAWLDEDEFLIRRRIHRDMAALLREGEAG
jgi:hypothetical protein